MKGSNTNKYPDKYIYHRTIGLNISNQDRVFFDLKFGSTITI